MNKILLTTALVALTALAACKKDSDVNNVAPAAGDETSMSAPVDATVTTDTTAAPAATTDTTTTTTTVAPAADAAATTPAEPTVAPTSTDATTTTTTTTTTTAPAADASATATCGDHSDLVGKAVADIDTKTLGNNVRVIKPGDAVTQDYSATRLNIDVGADGKVSGVHCG